MTENIDGVVKWKEYTFWTHANYIADKYIDPYLRDKFPNKLVIRELNKIDFTIPEENLPIEIQSTPVTTYQQPIYSLFESKIEKQIKQNINDCGKCYFFFDSELLRSMKNATKGISINLDWFRNFIKEQMLTVFTVRYDGLIEQKEYKDFDFIADLSQTIINKNKLNIYTNVVKGYGFVQEELDTYYKRWREYCDLNIEKKNDNYGAFLRKQKDDRSRLYGNILNSIGNLTMINNMLSLKDIEYSGGKSGAKSMSSVLGIFDVICMKGSNNSIAIFIDRFNICHYLPDYLENIDTWNYLKESKMKINTRQFEAIVRGNINPLDWKKLTNGGL
jgi:hypothetical protein